MRRLPQDIARSQSRTNMAGTWQGSLLINYPANYSETHAEGPRLRSNTQSGEPARRCNTVQMPGQPALEFPVESMIGGNAMGSVFCSAFPLWMARLCRVPPWSKAATSTTRSRNGLALELAFPKRNPRTMKPPSAAS